MQIALEKFSEATVGYRKNKESADKWVQLFNTSYFMVSAVSGHIHSLIDNLVSKTKFYLRSRVYMNRSKMWKELNYVER